MVPRFFGKEACVMTGFTDWLSALGEHFYLILIGCVELVTAVLLFGLFLRRKSRRASRSAHSGEEALLQAMDLDPDAVYLLVDRTNLLAVRSAGNIEELLGVTLERLQEDIDCLLADLATPDEGRKFRAAYSSWDGAEPLSTEVKTSGGEWIRETVIRCPNGKYDLFCFLRKTEDRKRLEEYQKKLDRAEEASQFKTSFLSRMSHEIRTPMNGIIGALTLAEGNLEPDAPAMQYLDKASELSDHLLSLINDILDMSRIEAGKVELEARPFSLRKLGQRLSDMFAKTLEAKGVAFAVRYEEMTVDWVVGDGLRVSQVIINFLSNAVKFTSKGEVTVTFRQMLLCDGMADLMIRVHDTGIGMEPEFLNRIFRPFEQEDASTTRRFGGTGLGMAIADQLVKLMGGQIVVESVPGKGSDFTAYLSLPVAENGTEKNTELSEEGGSDAFRGRKILMAEDNEINAMIATEILNDMGAEVDIAGDGKQAVEKFASRPPDTYDFILLDVQMPVMDGREAARAIRALDRPDAATIPMFALSADAFTEDERLSIESGMNGHFAKPVDFVELQKKIGGFLSRKEGAGK